MIDWHKRGLVYQPSGDDDWARSHALCPTPVLVGDGERIRVFCAFLDADRIGRCGWVDVDATDPCRIAGVSRRPALDVGQAGTFDEHGVTPLSVVRLPSGRLRLYYAGWQRAVGVRYFLFSGAAESDDDGDSFIRISEAPLLDRADGELHTRTGGLVLRGPDGWRMWYAGGSGWDSSAGDARPRYALRYLRSDDGIIWPRSGTICMEPREDELGFGRPCILERGGVLHMWFGRRALSGAYQLGYATSRDGLDWTRADHLAGLPLGPDGDWDSEMVGLAGMIETSGGLHLFYNGNGYGRTGFGVATAS